MSIILKQTLGKAFYLMYNFMVPHGDRIYQNPSYAPFGTKITGITQFSALFSYMRSHRFHRQAVCLQFKEQVTIPVLPTLYARRGGAEVAGWTLDWKIRVRFPAYPHRVWALWWQGGKRRLRTSRCPCRGRLGTLKTPSCPWRGCPAAGQNLETGHLSRHYIAEISLNVTLNHNQQSTTTNALPLKNPRHVHSFKYKNSSFYLYPLSQRMRRINGIYRHVMVKVDRVCFWKEEKKRSIMFKN